MVEQKQSPASLLAAFEGGLKDRDIAAAQMREAEQDFEANSDILWALKTKLAIAEKFGDVLKANLERFSLAGIFDGKIEVSISKQYPTYQSSLKDDKVNSYLSRSASISIFVRRPNSEIAHLNFSVQSGRPTIEFCDLRDKNKLGAETPQHNVENKLDMEHLFKNVAACFYNLKDRDSQKIKAALVEFEAVLNSGDYSYNTVMERLRMGGSIDPTIDTKKTPTTPSHFTPVIGRSGLFPPK